MAVARIVSLAAASGAINPINERMMLGGPLPGALLSTAGGDGREVGGDASRLRDSAACALACLQVAQASPATFKGILRAGEIRHSLTLPTS